MSSIINDGTLVRGTTTVTISGVTYLFKSFDDDGAAPRSEFDYDEDGKPYASSHAEDFRKLTGEIMARSDQVAPPKGVVFTYDSLNFMIVSRRLTGTTEGLKSYNIEAVQNISGSVTIS